METSILQQLKQKAGRLIEPQLKTSRVLEVRTWEPATMIEIDLHLPFADMRHWKEVPYIKFKVGSLCYRDYTPFGWDEETSTCTILVDAAHHGPGSLWAKQLQQNDTVQYLKIDTTHHSPDPTHLVVALGDESSMGHLLALQQMIMPVSRFTGGVLIGETQHRSQFGDYFRSPLQAIAPKNGDKHLALFNWVTEQSYCVEHTVFYLTGNNKMVSRLRGLLKGQGYLPRQIKVKGFWS
jgi:NADPH-dependent ferric siderophore reductase